jgi:hypothetical protein
LKPQDFADVYAFELARYEGRPAPRNPENFQTRYAQECDEARQTFDDFVAGREYVENSGYYFRRIFQPVDLGKFVVGRVRPRLFAQLSVEETRDTGKPEKATNRQRVIQFFPETADEMQLTEGGWSYLRPSGANPYALGKFIGSAVSLYDSRRRAIPSSVAILNEFKDTLSQVMEAARSKPPNGKD